MTDVDVDFDLDKAKGWKLDSVESEQVFKVFGFRSLAKRAKDLGKKHNFR